MSRQTQSLLEAFDHLSAEEKRTFAQEVFRRSLPFDSGPMSDQEISTASTGLFEFLDQEDADSTAR